MVRAMTAPLPKRTRENVLWILIAGALPWAGPESHARTKGCAEGEALNRRRVAVEQFSIRNEGQLPKSWTRLSEVYDLTPANLALSLSAQKPVVVQSIYALLTEPVRRPDGREILIIQREPAKDPDGNLMRRYVW